MPELPYKFSKQGTGASALLGAHSERRGLLCLSHGYLSDIGVADQLCADARDAVVGGRRPARRRYSSSLPSNASRPSLMTSGITASAATGSAHHQPTAAFRSRPISTVPDR